MLGFILACILRPYPWVAFCWLVIIIALWWWSFVVDDQGRATPKTPMEKS